METKALEYILEIARCRSITKAANNLGISQSALSQILLRVEREIDASLFTRQKRALQLTPAGELYVDTAQKIVHLRNKLSADLKDLSESRRLRIGVTSFWGMRMMKEILPVFYEKYPDRLVELKQYSHATLHNEFLNFKVDIAAGTLTNSEILPENCEILREEEMVLIVNKNQPFARKYAGETQLNEQALRDLEDVSFIRSAVGSTARVLEDNLFQRIGLKMRAFCEVTDYAAFIDLVEANLGFAFVSADYLESDDRVAHWHLTPKISRLNALYIRPGMELSECESFLIDAIRNYKLFKK